MNEDALNPYATAWKSEIEAAEYLGVDTDVVTILVKKGEIPLFRIGGENLFTTSSLDSYRDKKINLDIKNNVLHLSNKTK